MGVTVREKPKGSEVWWLFVNHQGKCKSKRVGDKRVALEAAKRIEAKLVLGDLSLDYKKAEIPTFGEYAETWSQTVLPATCKASTVSDYRNMLRKHILPVFGKRTINEITRANVKTFLTGKTNDGYAVSTVTHMKNVLSGVFTLAVEDQKLSDNPSQGLGK